MQISEPSEPNLSPKERSIANLKPFTAGISGNLLGRPPGIKDRRLIAKEVAEVLINAKGVDGAEVHMTAEHAMVAALFRKAIDGDVNAIKEIQDTLYGKITDKQEITGKDGEALKVDVTKLSPDEAYKTMLTDVT